jgi:hypothetical protein
MENVSKLMSAVLTAQKAFGAVLKDANNPHLKVKYASLGSVLDAISQPLLDVGVVLLQPAVDTGERDENGKVHIASVRTILIHAASGESFETTTSIPLVKADPQGYGSALTYARRYAILGLLGLAPEDDDGQAASRGTAANVSQARPPMTIESAKKRISMTAPDRLTVAETAMREAFKDRPEELKQVLEVIEARKAATAKESAAKSTAAAA